MQRSARHVATALLAGLTLGAGARAQLIAYDGFSNGPIANLGGSNGGAGWAGPWQDLFSSLMASVGGPGLTYPGLATEPGELSTPAGNLPDMAEYLRDFALPGGNSLFVSVLVRPENSYSNWLMLRFGNYPQQVDLGVPIGYYNYGLTVGRSFRLPSNVPTIQGETTLLVLEIQVNPGANHTDYFLYVNPTVGAPKPAVADVSYGLGPAISLVRGIEYRGTGGFTLDEIRIGTTWESVLPVAGPTCYANCDQSTAAPVLNVNDFVCFQAKFAAGDAYANCDRSTAPPVLNVNDFVCFQARFAAGCP
jgi:hypothetical protein